METRARIPVLVVALAAILFLFSGCGPSAEEIATQTAEAWTPTPTATLVPTNTPTPLPPTATPTTPTMAIPSSDAILDSLQAAMQDVSSYHFEMTMKVAVSMEGLSMDMPFTMVGDYQAPDRAQFMMSMEFLGTSMTMEMIQIGDTTYTTDPETGEWTTDTTTTDFAPIDPSEVIDTSAYDLENPEVVGIEEVDGVLTYHLSGTISAVDIEELFDATLSESLLTVDYWVGVDDYLLRKLTFSIEFTGSLMEEMEGTQEISMDVEMVISDYNAEVSIEPPID